MLKSICKNEKNNQDTISGGCQQGGGPERVLSGMRNVISSTR
jgi:hypothetical protein